MINSTCIIFISFEKNCSNFFTYIKVCKDSSAKYYQNNKEKLWKKARERCQSLPK